MGKGKMSLLDVRAMVKELKATIIGLRVSNVYHLNSRAYVLKLSGVSTKVLLVLESGVRVHSTVYHREHEQRPNMFATKLRKHIRTMRLEDIKQIGIDRVLDLSFGTGSRCYHVIVEIYAQGNIILTNNNYEILMLLRKHEYAEQEHTKADEMPAKEPDGQEADDEQADESTVTSTRNDDELIEEDSYAELEAKAAQKEQREASISVTDRVAIRAVYPLHRAQQAETEVTVAMVRSIISTWKAKEEAKKQRPADTPHVRAETELDQPNAHLPAADTCVDGQDTTKRSKQKQKLASSSFPASASSPRRSRVSSVPVKAVLSASLHIGPDLIEHCLLVADLDPNQSVEQLHLTDEKITALASSLNAATGLLSRIGEEKMKGWIVVREERGQDIQIKQPKAKKRNKTTNETANSAMTGRTTTQESVVRAVTFADVQPGIDNEEVVEVDPASDPRSSSRNIVIEKKSVVLVYSEYLSVLLAQHDQSRSGPYSSTACRLQEFPSFDAAMDEFYSKQEEQKELVRLMKEKAAALHKIDRVKQSHAAQLSALAAQQAANEYKAQLIETNLPVVDKCLESVNLELASGTDWKELDRIIKEQKQKGNPLAMLISMMNLHENTIAVNLSADPSLPHLHPSYSREAVPADLRPVKVDLDLSLSAANNAQYYYALKKKQALKYSRTAEASNKAILAAEKKAGSALKDVDQRANIQKLRKIYWWEKFNWFISSENYLIIGGKDAQQNEQLVKKYARYNDIYVHAEVHGASSVIIKNPHSSLVPPSTLQQAALMCICRSSAWKGKIPIEAYWVYLDQVSKSSPSGMYLKTGSFMIRGKKNFIPRAPLVMGIGILFCLDDQYTNKHVGERKPKQISEEETREAKTETKAVDTDETSNHSGDEQDFDVTSKLLSLQVHKKKSQSSETVDSVKHRTSASLSNAEEGHESEEKTEVGPGKKRVSAAEKRRKKKQHDKFGDQVEDSKEQSNTQTAQRSHIEEQATETSSGSNTTRPPNTSAAGALSRAQRAKQKKLQKKYGNQDEEDLMIAASILGLQNIDKKKKELRQRELSQATKPGSQSQPHKQALEEQETTMHNEHKDKTKNDHDAHKEMPPPSDSSDKVCFHCKQKGHVFKECPVHLSELSSMSHSALDSSAPLTFSSARRAAMHEEMKELVQLAAEEGIPGLSVSSLGTDGVAPLDALDGLTAKPLPDDHLQFAVSVCAPYVTLLDYKYKAKLLVGTQKKGKVAAAGLSLFIRQAANNSQEKELLRLIREDEVAAVLPSNVKIAALHLHEGEIKKQRRQQTFHDDTSQVEQYL